MSIEIKDEFDFDDLRRRCWGQALDTLEDIYNADKEDELMGLLLDMYFDTIPTMTEVNDFLAYEWEYICKTLDIEYK